MKTVLSILILMSSLTAFGQDTTYCLPIKQARAVFEDAVRSFTLDSIVHEQGQIIHLQQSAADELAASYRREISLVNQKFETQKEITADFVRLADGWKEEASYYQKKYKKQRRQKGLLTAVTVGLIIIIIAK